jgi:C-terminal processing protease CtpA/Prc
VNKLRFAAAGVLAVAGLISLAAGLTARPAAAPGDPPAPPVARAAVPPALTPGKWSLIEISPNFPDHRTVVATLTIAEKAGRPVITAVEDETFKWEPKDVTVAGRRVTFIIVRAGGVDRRFDGLFDPANPSRVLGSLLFTSHTADRAILEPTPQGGTPNSRNTQRPADWEKYMDLASAYHRTGVDADGPRFREKPAAEQAALRAAAQAAREEFLTEAPKRLRRLIADRPTGPLGRESVLRLLDTELVERSKPTTAEIDAWVHVARKFAATHGPQFEAVTLGEVASNLSHHAAYAARARTYAAEADRLAEVAGISGGHAASVAQFDEERAAWASQPNPPAAGSVWAVTLVGKVTDAKGNPIPDAEVVVNRTQWVKTITDDESYKATTGPDGRYTITQMCVGTYRLHVAHMWAEKRGFVQQGNYDRHKLLPGESATVNFTLTPGELFGGTLKLRPGTAERDIPGLKELQLLTVTGPGVRETVVTHNGEKFELTLPPGTYTVELSRGGGKKFTWAGLKTGTTDHVFEEPAFRFTPESVGDGFDRMWKGMDRNYSYFTLKPDIDWAKLREEYRPKAVRATSADELAGVLKEMLGRLKDGHVWIMTPDGQQIGTHRTPWSYNGNRQAVLAQLTNTTECGRYAVVGKTKPDGFGYFLMTQQSAATPELVAKTVAAIEKLADAPGFVIDLRNANGGSEPLAQEVAQLFCAEKVVYAKSKFRNGQGHDEFTEDYPRELPPAKSGRPYRKPVVCLLGPGCVSSGEGFAKMLAALPHVTTVGLPTRGSSGNPGPVEVGDTGLTVYYSRWVDMLPDGTPIEGRGVPVAVRVELPAAAYRDADPTLAKGLEVLRRKAAGDERPR